ncbi:hypothetical protein AVEN_198245-1 [Araneus ventricosus]|uniref:Uncharacterized protein n=1 Tax=Araneus ventricosus TaxID=182803 RepID=A0A4Y2SQN3_ARAVE|nr:hypothetical protein AVEN_198245-1 [Araneus ventricosus]
MTRSTTAPALKATVGRKMTRSTPEPALKATVRRKMTRPTPEPARLFKLSHYASLKTFHFRCHIQCAPEPYTRVVFPTWNLSVPKLRPYSQATAAFAIQRNLKNLKFPHFLA